MRRTVTLLTTLLAGWTLIAAAQQPGVLPMGPARERGASITPAYEGWYKNDDGSFSLLIGYYNRNSKEALTIRHRIRGGTSRRCSNRYPKGQEPKYRTTLSLVPAALGSMDIRPNTLSLVEGFTVLRENARIESYQPHMHLRGKAMMVEAIRAERTAAGHQPGERLQFQLDDDLRLRRQRRAAAAEGNDPEGHRVARQHRGQEDQSRSQPVGGLGDRTVDEMAHAWINIVDMKDDDFKAEQEKRRAAATTAAAPQQ